MDRRREPGSPPPGGQARRQVVPHRHKPNLPRADTRAANPLLEQVRRHAEDVGRDPSEVGVAYSAGMPSLGEAVQQPDGSRRPFTGDGEQVAGDIRGFAEAGVDDMAFRFERGTLEETLAAMEQFADEVMAKL